jgi:hypothetical protein
VPDAVTVTAGDVTVFVTSVVLPQAGSTISAISAMLASMNSTGVFLNSFLLTNIYSQMLRFQLPHRSPPFLLINTIHCPLAKSSKTDKCYSIVISGGRRGGETSPHPL